MNYDAHLQRYLNKYLADFGGECVSNVTHYCLDNGKPIAYANACNWWGHPALASAFDFVANNPSDPNQVPSRGAIVIWGANLPGSGGKGHISIFDRVASPGIFISCDANWGGAQVHFVSHTWQYVLGWLVPKINQPQGDNEMIANTDQADKIYKMLRPNGAAGGEEINATAGHRTFASFLNDAQGEIAVRDENLRNQAQQLANLSASINVQNQTITELTQKLQNAETSNTEKRKALDDAIAKIAETNQQLTVAHDKIIDLQGKLPGPVQVPTTITPAVNWFVKLLAKFISPKK